MIQLLYYYKYIKNTAPQEKVYVDKGLLCKIKPSLKTFLNNHTQCFDRSVFLSTKSLKNIYDRHIYDKNNAVIFNIILKNLTNIIRYPDEIRRNVDSKRGDFLFIKEIENQLFFSSVEVLVDGSIEIVSASATGVKYLEKFTLLWSWGMANSPS